MTPTQRNGWLITGGTGFLGRALARRLLAGHEAWGEKITRVCIYSRGEAAQAAMREEFNDDDRLRWFIGDVRDRDRLRIAMQSVHTVVHAAALKRVEVGAYNPTEMVKTNVGGAQNVIAAAIDAHVACVIAISTDKAVEPLNCYGATKLVAEKLFLGAVNLSPEGTKFLAVRYGNVAGSTGSVIPTWRAALAAGRPLTLRNPEATRFWITANQAVDQILRAWIAPTGSLLVPELPAYRLGDLLLAMLDGVPAQGPVFRLGPEEKLHESLLGFYEPGGPRTSDQAPRLSVEELRERLKAI